MARLGEKEIKGTVVGTIGMCPLCDGVNIVPQKNMVAHLEEQHKLTIRAESFVDGDILILTKEKGWIKFLRNA